MSANVASHPLKGNRVLNADVRIIMKRKKLSLNKILTKKLWKEH